MTQDNSNPPIIVENQPSTDPNALTHVDAISETDSPSTQVAEPVAQEDEEENAVTQEGEEAKPEDNEEDDESTESMSASPAESSKSVTTPNDNTNSSTAEAEKDERSELARQPYDFDHCTVQIAIQLLPDDGDTNGRMIVVGVRSHLDAPILRFIRMNELGPLTPLVATMLDELKAELPAREQAARDAYEKKKAEKAKRQTNVAASKTPARGKKNKKVSLDASPTAGATVPDNRPRPEVKVPTAAQQQMGLF